MGCRHLRLLLFIALVAAVGAACDSGEAVPCEVEADCPGGGTCFAGRCCSRPEGCEPICEPVDCSEDADCPLVLRIDEQNCPVCDCNTDMCESDQDCPETTFCSLETCRDNCRADDAACLDACVGACVPDNCACPETFDPVCGANGITYPNPCDVACVGLPISHEGACNAE